jgi:hypothetical protein
MKFKKCQKCQKIIEVANAEVVITAEVLALANEENTEISENLCEECAEKERQKNIPVVEETTETF